MTMRLLAYGGTSYSERTRVGTWSVASGVLGSRDGLRTGSSYGLGVTGTVAHLIFRELQNTESRGGYPFTLLLDPGREVWKEFLWNAAALLTALATDSKVFTHPEDVKIEASRLTPPNFMREGSQGRQSKLHVLLAGSITSETVVVVKPEDVGFSSRPTPEDWARALACGDGRLQLPCCSFTGLGWLVGGGRALAEGLGARLAIDEESNTSLDILSECTKAGERLLADWTRIGEWDETALARLAPQPPWEWERPPSEVVSRIRLLASLLDSEVPDHIFVDLQTSSDGLLEEAIREAARRAATSGDSSFSRERTAYLIEDCVRFGTHIDETTVCRMDKTTIVPSLLEHYRSPKEFPDAIRLPLTLVVEAWSECLARTPASERSLRLEEAGEHLESWPEVSDSDYALLVAGATGHGVDATHAKQFASLRSHPKFGKLLKKHLAPFVLKTVREKEYRKHTEAHFLWLTDDEVENELRQCENRFDRANEIVLSWLRELRGQYPGEVEARLQRLARSSMRKLLSSHVKHQAADVTEVVDKTDGPWSNYLLIYNLYHGAEMSGGYEIDEDEKDLLRQELHHFFCYESPAATPNLVALVRLLSPFYPLTVELIRKGRQPDPYAPGFTFWQEGLSLLGLEQARSDNILRQQIVTRGGDSPGRTREPSGPATKTLDPSFLSAKWRRWLFEAEFDPRELEDLDSYLRNEQLAAHAASVIEEILRQAEPAEIKCFAGRFFRQDRLEGLLKVLSIPSQCTVVSWFVKSEQFTGQFQSVMNQAIRKAKAAQPCGVLEVALATYLRTDQAEMISWAKTLFGPEAKRFEGWLKRIIDRENFSEAP